MFDNLFKSQTANTPDEDPRRPCKMTPDSGGLYDVLRPYIDRVCFTCGSDNIEIEFTDNGKTYECQECTMLQGISSQGMFISISGPNGQITLSSVYPDTVNLGRFLWVRSANR